MYRHRELLAWQACRELIREVYRVTRSFPPHERFGLTSQIRRAAVSSASNIAEGYARAGHRETAHAVSVTLGSLAEVDTLLVVAEDAGFLPPGDAAALRPFLERAIQLSAGLLRRIRQHLT